MHFPPFLLLKVALSYSQQSHHSLILFSNNKSVCHYNHCWVPPNSDQPGRSARGHYVITYIIVILTLMPDYNARAYDLLSVGTLISKDNLNLVCLLARWGQGDRLGY